MMISVFIGPDGTATVRLPKGHIPDHATLERVADAIRMHRMEAVA